MLFWVATFSTMAEVRNVLVFLAMALVAMAHVQAVTYPGDIEALKEVRTH
jgi:hypothetical protein